MGLRSFNKRIVRGYLEITKVHFEIGLFFTKIRTDLFTLKKETI